MGLWALAPSGLRLLLLRPPHHPEPVCFLGKKSRETKGFLWNETRSNTKHQIGRFYILCHVFFVGRKNVESNEVHKQVKIGLLAGHKWQETQVVVKWASF